MARHKRPSNAHSLTELIPTESALSRLPSNISGAIRFLRKAAMAGGLSRRQRPLSIGSLVRRLASVASAAHPPLLALMLLLLSLSACAPAPVSVTPTPAITLQVATPFAVYLGSLPLARLYDQPGGTTSSDLPPGINLRVDGVTTTPDGQIWYQVTISTGVTGWLPAAALSPVDIRPTATPVVRMTPTGMAAQPTAAATPTPPRPLVVTGSAQGLFLRARPGRGEVLQSYPDGTRVIPLGEEIEQDGQRWLKVRVPDGREGWMAAQYLRAG